ncbi:MAG: hypothetical protein HQM03_14890 [Magnetococcales bacterium]|nr:hypothetical protein [Magnetococcales bacterium]
MSDRLSAPRCRLPLVVAVAFLCLLLLCLLNLGSLHGRQAAFLDGYRENLYRKQAVQARQLSNAVAEIQNQLTDISATLGQDGLDHGFRRAREAREEFLAGLDNLMRLVARQGSGQGALEEIALMTEAFTRYYEQGLGMARAYMHSGTLEGNRKMRLFDDQARELREMLAGVMRTLERDGGARGQGGGVPPERFRAPEGLANVLWMHLMGQETREHYVRFLTRYSDTAAIRERNMNVSLLAQGLRGHVLDVQQWLTDLSATRGRDDMDEGAQQARQAAERFQAELPAFLEQARQADRPERMAGIADLAQRFAAFYAKGVAMADAYVREGTRGGNPLMREFDAMADALGEALLPFIEGAMRETLADTYQLDLVRDSLREIFRVLMFLSLLVVLLTGGGAMWFVSCSKTVPGARGTPSR